MKRGEIFAPLIFVKARRLDYELMRNSYIMTLLFNYEILTVSLLATIKVLLK